MTGNELDDMNIYDVLCLDALKVRPDILSEIKLDVTPQMMMEPRFQSRPEDLEKLKEISGYIFYIETETEPPSVMLLKIGRTDITTTVGHVAEVPAEMVRRAVDKPLLPPVNGMCAITDEIRDWLRQALSL
ncbi:MAG: hypothetical protein HZB62_11185 [Nitrospirae bacterium]|nr:hypothetical protein [Nitrospirota bacterium]